LIQIENSTDNGSVQATHRPARRPISVGLSVAI